MINICKKIYLDSENIIIKTINYLLSDFKDDFQNLDNDALREKYNLTFRELNSLIKYFNLKRQKESKFNQILKTIDKNKFEQEYKQYSKLELTQIYNLSDAMIGKLIKYFDLHLTREEINNKVKNTSIKKYGCEYYSQTDEYADKIKKTNLEKYGVENAAQAESVKEKIKQTCLERYGVTNANKTEFVREKIRQTNLIKYGKENYYETDDFKIKAKKTKLERYDDENFVNSEKTKQTCLERYGVINPNQSEIIKNKRVTTVMCKYGVENVFQDDDVKNKVVDTCLKKYGVQYPCMTSQCRNASTLNDSSANLSFIEKLNNLNINYSREFSIDRLSYDFKINNILIEINPTATHNSTWGWRGNKEKGLDKFYHQSKSELAAKNGYRCICIWDWDNSDIILKTISIVDKVYARKCKVSEINDETEVKNFLISNHVQGYVKSSINIGLYYNDDLISVMTFGKPRYNKKYDIELLRYCSSKNVIGGAEKLFKFFLDNYPEFNTILSYCDMSKFTGTVYDRLKFKLISKGQPSKHWYNIRTKQHITDNLLRQRGFDQLFHTKYGKSTSNNQLMLDAGFVEVYDCGQNTYVYNRK